MFAEGSEGVGRRCAPCPRREVREPRGLIVTRPDRFHICLLGRHLPSASTPLSSPARAAPHLRRCRSCGVAFTASAATSSSRRGAILPYLNVSLPAFYAFRTTCHDRECADGILDLREMPTRRERDRDLVVGIKVRVGKTAAAIRHAPWGHGVEGGDDSDSRSWHLDFPPPAGLEVGTRLRPGGGSMNPLLPAIPEFFRCAAAAARGDRGGARAPA